MNGVASLASEAEAQEAESGNPTPGRIRAKSGRFPSRRNPFPGEPFFIVPIALYDQGLVRLLRPSGVLRYFTLCRLANYCYSAPVKMNFRSLEELDGISLRAARDATNKLEEYGLICVAKTRPFTYTLNSPAHWKEFGRMKPSFKQDRSLTVRREWTSR